MSEHDVTSNPVQYLPYEPAPRKQHLLRWGWIALMVALIAASWVGWSGDFEGRFRWESLIIVPTIYVVVMTVFSANLGRVHRKLAYFATEPGEDILFCTRFQQDSTANRQGLGVPVTVGAQVPYGPFVAVVEPEGLRLFDGAHNKLFIPRERVHAVQAIGARWNELGLTRLQFRVTGGTVSFLVNKPWLRWLSGTANRAEVEAIAQRIAKKWSYPGTGAESSTLTQPGSL